MKRPFVRGAWQLKDIHGPVNLFTRSIADVYTNRKTKKEYYRGEYINFYDKKDFPPLIEDTGDYDAYHAESSSGTISTNEAAKEILVSSILKK